MHQVETISSEIQPGPAASTSRSSTADTMAIGSAAPAWEPAPFKRLVTTHKQPTASDAVEETYHAMSGDGRWQQVTPNAQFSLIYTTSTAKPEMSNDADVADHEALLGSGKLSLVNVGQDGGGSVCRAVEFAPVKEGEMSPYMHRTQSLDYGIVVAGQIELLLPNEPPRLMNVGDVAVQRGTNHAWRNASSTESARMVFVLLASEKIKFEGEELKEELPNHGGHTADVMKAKRV